MAAFVRVFTLSAALAGSTHTCARGGRLAVAAISRVHMALGPAEVTVVMNGLPGAMGVERLQRFVFGFLLIHHFYQLPTSA
ncbi:hypothetical protein T492DRAFT_895500 [Pavlovales sp. CCMP2436]|nr:hypothetical protein T492DRAFT_895500 [Pavlovales sp. CCMP2436]